MKRKEIKGNCESFKGTTATIKNLIENGMKLSPPDEAFQRRFQPWFDENFPKAAETETYGNRAKEYYVDMAKFLGEDEASMKKKQSGDYFKDLNGFFKGLKTLHDQEKAKREREAKAKKAAAAKK